MGEDGRPAGRGTVWQPGQSGNPRGGSEKQRRQRQIREWIADIADQQIPDNLLEMMRAKNPEFVDMLPPDVTFGFVEAFRLHILAVSGDQGGLIAAMGLLERILPEPIADPPTWKPPRLPSTEEQRREVARELGVDLETDPEGHQVN